MNPISLPVVEKDIQSILRVFSDFAKDERDIITQLLNTLLTIHGKIYIVESTPLFIAKKVWLLKHKSDFYPLIAPFVTIDKDVSEWFLTSGNVKEVVHELIDRLDRDLDVVN